MLNTRRVSAMASGARRMNVQMMNTRRASAQMTIEEMLHMRMSNALASIAQATIGQMQGALRSVLQRTKEFFPDTQMQRATTEKTRMPSSYWLVHPTCLYQPSSLPLCDKKAMMLYVSNPMNLISGCSSVPYSSFTS